MMKSMMAHANLPISFWEDALLTAAYILNKVPSKSVSTTPYELWTGRKPNFNHLGPWGSMGFIHLPTQKTGKLDTRAKNGTFKRYSKHSKSYVFVYKQENGGFVEIESRDVDFINDEFPSSNEPRIKEFESGSQETPLITLGKGERSQTFNELRIAKDSGSTPFSGSISSMNASPSGSTLLDEMVDPKPRRNKRGVVPRRCFEIEGESFMCASIDDDEPSSYKDALSSLASRE